MGNICIKLLNKYECTICQKDLTNTFYWTCECGNKYHTDCARVNDYYCSSCETMLD